MRKIRIALDALGDAINATNGHHDARFNLVENLARMVGYLVATMPERERLAILDFAVATMEERFTDETGISLGDNQDEHLPDQNAPSSDAVQ
jgi:hypothetical protein